MYARTCIPISRFSFNHFFIYLERFSVLVYSFHQDRLIHKSLFLFNFHLFITAGVVILVFLGHANLMTLGPSMGEQVSNMGERVSSLGGQVSNMGEQVSNMGERVSSLGEQVSNMGERVSNMGEQVSNLGEKFANMDEHIADVGKQVHQLSRDVSLLTNAVFTALNHSKSRS